MFCKYIVMSPTPLHNTGRFEFAFRFTRKACEVKKMLYYFNCNTIILMPNYLHISYS